MVRHRLAVLVLAAAFVTTRAGAEEIAALYRATWAGLPAGEVRLTMRNEPLAYRDEIAMRTVGLPQALIRFRASAASDGRLAAAGLPTPARYDALYDLRKRKDRRLSMQFAARAGGVVAERGPADTSTKPPLAENFRSNVLDPLSALAAIRHELRRGNRSGFTLPVYDGARRFDVVVRVLPKRGGDPALNLELTLAPLAGFKGETSDEGDPDNAKRVVELRVSDDPRLLPLAMSVPLYYLPLVVELAHPCDSATPCPW